MTTEKVFELWCDNDFRDYVKDEVNDASRKFPHKYKEFLAHVWMRLSQTKEDMTIDRYKVLAVLYALEARKIEYAKSVLTEKEFKYFYPERF